MKNFSYSKTYCQHFLKISFFNKAYSTAYLKIFFLPLFFFAYFSLRYRKKKFKSTLMKKSDFIHGFSGRSWRHSQHICLCWWIIRQKLISNTVLMFLSMILHCHDILYTYNYFSFLFDYTRSFFFFFKSTSADCLIISWSWFFFLLL